MKLAPERLDLPATLPDGSPWPRISVVTPSYNQGRFIEETIRSVLDQDYPNLEYIVMDGGSSDETMSIVDRYRHRMAHVESQPDRGQSHAINKGMARATGEILTWINSDDVLVPGALAAMAVAFHTSGADLVAGICELHKDGELINAHLTSCPNGPLPLHDLLDLDGCWNTGKFFYQPEVMFTRELWQRAGGHVDESWFYSMDYELWLRFAEAGARLHVIGRPIVRFRLHDEQKTGSTDGFMAELPKVRDAFLARTGRELQQRAEPMPGLPRLRIVYLNDLGNVGGAAIAHQRLARSATLAGHLAFPVAISQHIDPTTPAATDDNVVRSVARYQPDLVVVGNLHGAGMASSLLAAVAGRWPTVFVLHDVWLLSGRCAYHGDCRMYLDGCDHTCPTPHEYPPLAPGRIRAAWQQKRELLRGNRAPLLACNSEWTAAVVRKALASSPQGRSSVATIHYSLPIGTFRPRHQRRCREQLDLPQDRFIVLFSASSLDDRRKGAVLLAEAIDSLALDDLLPVCLGHVPPVDNPVTGMRCMGYVDDEERLALLYSAADVYVGPSLEEAFGQVFIEAAACGTPSVAFPVGGIPEAVCHGVSGLVTERSTSAALARTIRRLYDDPDLRRDLAGWGRIWVENEWSEQLAWHRMFQALDAAGLRQKLQLPPKIFLVPDPPPVAPIAHLDTHYPAWRALTARSWRMGWWFLRNGWWLLSRMTRGERRQKLRTMAHKVARSLRSRGRRDKRVG